MGVVSALTPSEFEAPVSDALTIVSTAPALIVTLVLFVMGTFTPAAALSSAAKVASIKVSSCPADVELASTPTLICGTEPSVTTFAITALSAATSSGVSNFTSRRPSPCVSTFPLNCCSCDTERVSPELTTTFPTFVKSAAFVRMSTVPSSMTSVPPPKSIELPAAKTSVSKSSCKSKVSEPPSRSTFTRRSMMSSAPTVTSSITMRTSPEPVIVSVALTADTCEEVSCSSAPASTANVTPERSAPSAKATLSVVAFTSPDTVTEADPKSALARNVTPPVVSIVAETPGTASPPRSTSVSASIFVTTTAPSPMTESPEMTSASTVKATSSTLISATSPAAIVTALPELGVNTKSDSSRVRAIPPLSVSTIHCFDPLILSFT